MLEWGMTSSVLILVVLVLRRVLMGKISLRLQYGLWALVLVRLLLPISLGTTAVSVLNVVERAQVQISDPILGHMGDGAPRPPVDGAGPSQPPPQWQAPPDEPQVGTGTPVSLGTVLLGVWGAGAAALGLWLVWVDARFARTLRRSRRPLRGMGCPLPVYVTGAIQTPCLFGLFHPAIYVTEEVAADETVLRHSLAHESTHFRHKDHIWAVLRGLCLALHWYDPLVWVAAVLSRRDGELCCDASTVRLLGEEERAAYGRTLLAVTCRGRDDLLLSATSMGGGGIRERIVLLTKRPKTAVHTLAAVVLVAAVAVGCTFTGAQETEQGEDAVLYQLGDGLVLAIPADIAEELLVEFPDDGQREPRFPRVYHRASYEAGMEDFGSPMGFLFTLFRMDQVEYEQTYLAADGGTGQLVFARDGGWYYGMGIPTDVQFYAGSDEIDTSSPGYQRWEYICSQVDGIQADFTDRNGLTRYDAGADLSRPFLWEGAHRYVECRSSNGPLSLTLLLSQPARQGDGGIWCVEGRLERSYGLWERELPAGIQTPAAEYYQALQAEADAGRRPELLDPIQAAMDWLQTEYGAGDLSDVSVTLLEDYRYHRPVQGEDPVS